MRIESIGSGPASVVSQSQSQTTASAVDIAAKSSASTTTTAIDPATGDPVPPKYPWITRLTLELEKNAQHSSPFESAKIVGETVNKVA